VNHLQRIMRIFAHLIRNIESTAMPVTLDRIEAELGITIRRESPDAGKP
jgi:hypothetical protein